jgi:hypothetical protein
MRAHLEGCPACHEDHESLKAHFFPPFLPPFFDAALFEPAFAFEILAARFFDMPFLRRPSYCLSFLTLDPWSLAIGRPPPSLRIPTRRASNLDTPGGYGSL